MDKHSEKAYEVIRLFLEIWERQKSEPSGRTWSETRPPKLEDESGKFRGQ